MNLRERLTRPRLGWLSVAVLAVTLALRLFALDRFAPGVQHDEVFVANFARTILQGQFPIFFEQNRGNEPLFMYLVAAMFKVFGEDVWALRATAALCGFGAVLLTYLWAREAFSSRDARVGAINLGIAKPEKVAGTRQGEFIALVTGAGLAVSFWSLYESRIGLHTISTFLLAAATFYAFWRGWTSGNRVLLLASGILAGLAAYTYRSGIFVPVALALFMVYTLIWHRSAWGRNGWLIPVVAVLAVIVYAPLFLFITSHPDTALARLGDLSGDLDALRQGNLVPMLGNLVRVFGMFGVSGDPEWRYNVAFRPVFDPAWAALFYAGILVCIWRFRRAEYALALIWLIVMLLPSILSASDLSQHRAVGAMGAAFLMPALALNEARLWLGRRGRGGRIALTVATALLVVIAAVGGLQAYFVTWANNPEVRLIQRADLAEAAHWLDEHQGEARALVSAEFANDLDRGSFNLEARTPNRAQFFQGADTFVIPEGTRAYVVDTRSGPIAQSLAAPFLSSAPVYETRLADGTRELAIYDLGGDQLQRWRESDATELAHTQDGQLTLTRADVPEFVKTGEQLTLDLWWKIGQPQVTDADALVWTARLTAPASYVWADAASMGFTPSQWHTGDIVLSQFRLDVPADMPPFPNTGPGSGAPLAIALDSTRGNIPLVRTGGGTPAGQIVIGQIGVMRGAIPTARPELPIRYPSKAKFTDAIQLLGSDAAGEASAGGEWQLVLFWKANARVSSPLTVRLTAETEAGELFARQEEALTPTYPTDAWQPGDYVRSVHEFKIPEDAPRGKAVIRVSLWANQRQPFGRRDGAPIAGIDISGRTRVFTKPSVATPREARLGDAVELLGYAAPTREARAGHPFSVTLYWHALKPADRSYTVFVHVLDATGKVVGQQDSIPAGGEASTDTWQADEYLADSYSFQIAAQAGVGPASLEIGMYDANTGQRLAVNEDNGVQGDAVTVPGFTVAR